jgi:hydrogenase nickel incorporation protein HypB
MCTVCGCDTGDTIIEGHHHDPAHEHSHDHAHPTSPPSLHVHAAGMDETRIVQLEQDILSKNNSYAEQNRRYFRRRGIFALNLISSPGAGKTSLLEATIHALKDQIPIAVVEGDQQTSLDADRIRASGVPAVQINTGKACHLDAAMVGRGLEQLTLESHSLLLIENVGNLICPAPFDLGEAHKVVVLSVTEGEDKPLKYPDMFLAAELMLINKIDLLPHVNFNLSRCVAYARRVNPAITVMEISVTRGDGLDKWSAWIKRHLVLKAVSNLSSE